MKSPEYFPEVSIIIAARNCEKDLPDTLSSIKTIDYPKENIEVIVIDDASTDDTASIAQKLSNKVIKRTVRGGCPGARNTGIMQSSNEIVVFVDADVSVTKNWLKKLVQPFKDNLVWATGGFIKNKINKENNLSKYKQLDLEYRKRSKNTKSVPGSNSAFRRIVFEELGLFNTKLKGAEDTEISYKILNAGYKLVFVEDAVIYHPFPSDIISYFRKEISYSLASTLMYAKDKHLIKNDEHTPWHILIQPIILLFIPFLTYIFSLYKTPILFFTLIMTPILMLNANFLYLIMRNEISLVPYALFYIFIRITAWTIGMVLAQLILIRAYLVRILVRLGIN